MSQSTGASAPKAPQSPEADKLRSTIELLDALSQEGFSEISAIASLALARMETPGCYHSLGDIAYALIAIKSKAEDIENCINAEAEGVGCNHIDQSHRQRMAAEYESQKGAGS
jgi:hypothetical protein